MTFIKWLLYIFHKNDVSEPVNSIIKAVKDRPDTFKCTEKIMMGGSYCIIVVDSLTGLKISALSLTSKAWHITTPFKLTYGEQAHLVDAGRELLRYKIDKIEKIKRMRSQRGRERWVEKYRKVEQEE